MGQVEVRPLTDDDVEAAAWIQMRSIGAVYATPEKPYQDPPPDVVERCLARVRHCAATDPGGAWVAEDEQGVSGVALSVRRGPLWFLSLLAVRGDVQAVGTGRALLEACHRTAEGATMGAIAASRDPRALRRYHALGFALEPSLQALGPLDRSLLTADAAVRSGDLARDGELVEHLVTSQRGAPLGPDLQSLVDSGCELLVIDAGAERGVCLARAGSVVLAGGTGPAVAARVLAAGLATAVEDEASVTWLTARSPWAVDVAMALRLPLSASGAFCVRGGMGPMAAYLPSGVYG